MKAIAKLCRYTDHERSTPHGRRVQGILLVANINVGPGLMYQLVGGHSSLKMVSKFHRPNQYAEDTAARAKCDSPTKFRADLCCVKEEDSSCALLSQHASLDSISPKSTGTSILGKNKSPLMFLSPLKFASEKNLHLLLFAKIVLHVRYLGFQLPQAFQLQFFPTSLAPHVKCLALLMLLLAI